MIDRVLWLILAAGHLLPVLPVVRPEMLMALYGIASEGDLGLLMRHRAVLFLAIVVVAVWAAFDPAVRGLAAMVLALSISGFLVIYVMGGMPMALRQIAIVDAVMVPVLAVIVVRLATA